MIRTIKSFTFNLIIVALLTLFTQVGGIIWLLSLPFFQFIKLEQKWKRRLVKFSLFAAIYLLCTFFIVPPLAKWQCGRVPLPFWSNPNLKPQSVFYYCILNHHYVRPELKVTAEKVAKSLSEKHPGTVLCYLDANFPFINGYPLEPHFSHRDGKKLDVALHWKKSKNDQPIFGTPSFLGYGACAESKKGEIDMEQECKQKGNWFRSFEKKTGELTYDKEKYQFDETITGNMIRLFAQEKSVGKILLEPHLKQRLGLSGFNKIRFQGCRAARHDDHIHVQL